MTDLFKKVWTVNIIESERGWGQRLEATETFDSEEDAKTYVKRFNSRNTEDTVPDWYMYAENPRAAYVKV